VLIAFHFSLLSSFSVTVPCGPSSWLPSPQSQTFTARSLYHIVSLNRHCVRWGSSSPRKGAQQTPPPGAILLDHRVGTFCWTKTKTKTFLPTLLWHGRPSQQLMSSCSVMIYAVDQATPSPRPLPYGTDVVSCRISLNRRRHLK